MKNYDVLIIGGGIGGLMCAYRLLEKNSALKVAILEKGKAIEKRNCPIVTKTVERCINCKSCSIMEGMAGAGAFSDGKYVITTEYGGWLSDFIGPEKVIEYVEQADEILVSFGATTERYMPSDKLRAKCLQYDLHMSRAMVKHLGTDSNFETMKKLIESLSGRCDIITECEAREIDKNTHTVTAYVKGEENVFSAEHIVFAVGRVGSGFLSDWCRRNNIELNNNQVDIGVRVELPACVWEDFSSQVYEPKIWYRSKQYGDVTRTFCFNERGNVVTENTGGILSVNGHSFRDPKLKTENSNFALLSTMRFTKPFHEPIAYAKHVAGLANLISGGSVLVQRLGDLEIGRRTDEKRLAQSTTRPTLNAVAGDLSLCLPKRQLDNIIETLHALDKIAPGTANYDTLLYGVECKYYSARPQNDDFVLSGCEKIYALGDGAGITRSLAQAAANGLYIGDKIINSK